MFYVYIEVLIVFSWENLVYSRIASLSNIQAKEDDRMRENKSKTWNKILLRFVFGANDFKCCETMRAFNWIIRVSLLSTRTFHNFVEYVINYSFISVSALL